MQEFFYGMFLQALWGLRNLVHLDTDVKQHCCSCFCA